MIVKFFYFYLFCQIHSQLPQVRLNTIVLVPLKPERQNAIKEFVKGHDVFVCLIQ